MAVALDATCSMGSGQVHAAALAAADGSVAFVDLNEAPTADSTALAEWLADPAVPKALHDAKGQRLALAACLIHDPKLLLLDEPTAELDPASSLAVFELLARYARENGTTVIVVEQKIALLSDFADMLLIVDGGKVRFQGAPAEVLEHSDERLEVGVNCPRSTSLVNRLRARGLVDTPAARNVDEAVKACKQVLSGEGALA